jgi:transcriptional regulator with XRE-family HTH domain
MIKQDSFYKKLGEKIKKARTDAGFTLESLNNQSGLNLTKGSFSAMENGKQQISAYQLYRISKALHIPLDTFVEGLEEEKLNFPENDTKKINEI